MTITYELLNQGRSTSGGWSKQQLRLLGVTWPLRTGWKKALVGKVELSPEAVSAFLALKNAHQKSVRPVLALNTRRPVGARRRVFQPDDAWTNTAKEQLLNKVNAAEEHIDRVLKECSVKYFRERPIKIGTHQFFMDFLVTSIKAPSRKKVRVAIEVDGGYHRTPEQLVKDIQREKALLSTCRVNSILRISDRNAAAITPDVLMTLIISMPHGAVRRLGGTM